ncbi:HAD family hydrolase [Streptosporangiaceae bacterium NEAU-GS5]|nr:HAD family hydrolase [Streptosporangiaceae bacterium NEAU-GS5]
MWMCDLDGTLVDSTPVHEAAFRAAIAELAPGLLGSFRYGPLAGTTTHETTARLGVESATADRLARRKQQIYREYVDAGRVPLFPGARELLDLLTRRGFVPYMVTSGSRGSVERVLTASGLDFVDVLTADELPASKPDPLVYRYACERWAADPAEVVVLEDSANGVAAAVGAGLLTLHVHVDLAAPGATAVQDLGRIVSALERP